MSEIFTTEIPPLGNRACQYYSVDLASILYACLFTGIREEHIWFLDPLLYSQEDSTCTS